MSHPDPAADYDPFDPDDMDEDVDIEPEAQPSCPECGESAGRHAQELIARVELSITGDVRIKHWQTAMRKRKLGFKRSLLSPTADATWYRCAKCASDYVLRDTGSWAHRVTKCD